MIGEGAASFEGRRMPGGAALEAAGIAPLTLGPKEGLALLNGTQFSSACALAASSTPGGRPRAPSRSAPFRPMRSWDRPSRSFPRSTLSAATGASARSPRRRGRSLPDRKIRESHRDNDIRVQDPYCIRCQPQVLGACIDLFRQSAGTLRIEANGATDNPLVLMETGRIASGGNFHAEPVAFAADQIALGVAETGSIAQRRIAIMVDPELSFGLSPFLSPDPGTHSG